MHKSTGEVWGLYRLVILVINALFWMHKTTDGGLGPIETSDSGDIHVVLHAQFHRWGLGTIETSNSDAKHAVLFAQIHRRGLGPLETINSGGKHAVLHAQIHRWSLGPLQTCNSRDKRAVLNAQNHRWRAGSYRDLWFWWYSLCFACTKRQVMSGTHRDL